MIASIKEYWRNETVDLSRAERDELLGRLIADAIVVTICIMGIILL